MGRHSARLHFRQRQLGIELVNNANINQPAPMLTSAVQSGDTTVVQGTLTAAPDSTYTIEFFANNVCDPSGFGQGQTFLQSITVTTDANGMASFTKQLIGVDAGQFLTATATSPTNDTSEFSNRLAVSD